MQVVQECKSIGGWQRVSVNSSDPDKAPYDVMVSPWAVDDSLCGCLGYEYRGTCRHIRIAYDLLCLWEEGMDPKQTPEQRRQRICPRCGQSTRAVVVEDDE